MDYMITKNDRIDKSIFPDRLKMTLFRKGMSQVDLAEAVGVRKQTISSYCQGRCFPRIDMIEKIANALGVEKSYLLGFEGDIVVAEVKADKFETVLKYATMLCELSVDKRESIFKIIDAMRGA